MQNSKLAIPKLIPQINCSKEEAKKVNQNERPKTFEQQKSDFLLVSQDSGCLQMGSVLCRSCTVLKAQVFFLIYYAIVMGIGWIFLIDHQFI